MTDQLGLPIADLSVNLDLDSIGTRQLQMSQRAKSVVDLELLEGRVYGYDTVGEGMLIPWPESGHEQSQNITIYASDIVVYNHSCHWTPVEFNYSYTQLAIVIPGATPKDGFWSLQDSFKSFDRLPEDGMFNSLKLT